MRIAMFTNNYKPYIGGVPVSIEHLAQALRQRGHEVYVFAPTYKGQEEEPYVIRYPSFPVKVAGAPVPDVLTRLFLKKVRELHIEVIHVHHPALVGNVALSLKRKIGIPVVFTYHTCYEQYLHYLKPLERLEQRTGLIQWYLRAFCKKCDLLLAPTPGIRDQLRHSGISVPVGVLPTGIPGDRFRSGQKRDMRGKADAFTGQKRDMRGKADYLFVTVSRLAKEKNLFYQLSELAILKELLSAQGKTFRHVIIGDGPLRDELQKEAKRLKIEENLIFTGNIPNADIPEYLAAADLFLFTSRSETQGIVVLEAMAAGLPVAAVEATGVRDVVVSGQNGMLCPQGSGWLADTVLTILQKPEKYRQMQQAAVETALAYSEETVAERAERYYISVEGDELWNNQMQRNFIY